MNPKATLCLAVSALSMGVAAGRAGSLPVKDVDVMGGVSRGSHSHVGVSRQAAVL